MNTNTRTANQQLPIVEIAKRVRAEIKAAQKAGTLAAGKISVTIDRYSMGCSLDVVVMSSPVKLHNPARLQLELAHPNNWWDLADYQALPRFTAEGAAMLAALEAIVAPYHRDDSDPMTDYYSVNFAKTITIERTRDDERAALEAERTRDPSLADRILALAEA